jgi:hypothetical protein
MQLPSTSRETVVAWGSDVHRALTNYELAHGELEDAKTPSTYQAELSQKAKALCLQAQSWRLKGQASDSDGIQEQAVYAATAYINEAHQFSQASHPHSIELVVWQEALGISEWTRVAGFSIQ